MKKLLVLGDPNDAPDLKERFAARAVLLNENGEVHLMLVSKHRYHKLPGGGIDNGESIDRALHRELMEEVGCRAEIIAELGIIEEFRSYDDNDMLHQISYCYLAKQVGDQQESALEEDEIEEGLQHVLAPSLEVAISMLENDEPNNKEGEFIRQRDLAFLIAAKEHIL